MTLIKVFTIAGIALGLSSAAALAGPGSVPEHLLRKPEARRQDARPAYALTGTTRTSSEGWRVRTESIGGARDQRTVFDRGAAR
jgi:hypothetical protein